MPPSLFPPTAPSVPARTPSPNPNGNQPYHNYSAGIPQPPRILIPPPLPPMSTPFTNPMITPSSYSHSIPIATPKDARALQAFSTLLPSADWKYECRRQAQQLLPNLYLGPLAAARDQEFLRRERIGLVIGVRAAGRKWPGAPVGEGISVDGGQGTRFETVDVPPGPGILSAIEKGAELIDRETMRCLGGDPNSTPRLNVRRLLLGLSDGSIVPEQTEQMTRTLLYCETGNERSAAVAVGYVMRCFDVDTVRAVQFVQSRRFCIAFNEEIKGCLVTFEGVVRAKRMVEGAQQQQTTAGSNATMTQNNGGGRGRKRGSYEEEDEEGMEGRGGVAPFADPASQPVDADMEMEM